MRLPLFVSVLWFAGGILPVAAQTPLTVPPPAREIPLYAGAAPGSEPWNWTEHTFTTRRGNDVTQNVVRPILQYYPADKAKACGTAVIIAPGGGFTNLMVQERLRAARALNAMGVEAFVLMYRLVYVNPAVPLPPPGPNPKPLPPVTDSEGIILAGPQKGQNIIELDVADGQRAVRWLRVHGKEFGIKPHCLGMIGFSAGGVVTLDTATRARDARPDFAGLFYGARNIPFTPPSDAPPLFLAVAADDESNTQGSLNLFNAWHDAHLPAELHIFQTGAHGFLIKGGGADQVMDRLEAWMRLNGWMQRG